MPTNQQDIEKPMFWTPASRYEITSDALKSSLRKGFGDPFHGGVLTESDIPYLLDLWNSGISDALRLCHGIMKHKAIEIIEDEPVTASQGR